MQAVARRSMTSPQIGRQAVHDFSRILRVEKQRRLVGNVLRTPVSSQQTTLARGASNEVSPAVEGAIQSLRAGGQAFPQSSIQRKCVMHPVSRSQYLNLSGTTRWEYGITPLPKRRIVYPEIKLLANGRRWTVEGTRSVMPPVHSYYTVGSWKGKGFMRVLGRSGRCQPGTYRLKYVTKPGGRLKLAAGEREHCKDYNYAFRISIERFTKAVNKIANSRRSYRNRHAVEKKLVHMLGVPPGRDPSKPEKPINWISYFLCLAKQSLRRDRPYRWHSPRFPRPKPPRSYPCRYAIVELTSASLRDVGKFSSPVVITGCKQYFSPRWLKRQKRLKRGRRRGS